MQDHAKPGSTVQRTEPSPVAPNSLGDKDTGGHSLLSQGKAVAIGEPPHMAPKSGLEYFQEYELTLTSKPEFDVVECPGGKEVMVSWGGVERDSNTQPSPAVGSGVTPAATNTDSPEALNGFAHVPSSGAVIVTIAGESVAGVSLEDIIARLQGKGKDENVARDENNSASSGEAAVRASPTNGSFPLVVRFRERTAPRQEGGHGSGGSEIFRSRMKAMATGLGNLFQVKEAGGSAVRDGSDIASTPATAGGTNSLSAASDVFVLTFALPENSGTEKDLPFTMAEMTGGQGVLVSGVEEDYESSLVRPEEVGVSTAGTAAVVAADSGDAGAALEALSPGAVLLRVAGQSVEGKGLERVRKVVETAAAAHSTVRGCALYMKGKGIALVRLRGLFSLCQ